MAPVNEGFSSSSLLIQLALILPTPLAPSLMKVRGKGYSNTYKSRKLLFFINAALATDAPPPSDPAPRAPPPSDPAPHAPPPSELST